MDNFLVSENLFQSGNKTFVHLEITIQSNDLGVFNFFVCSCNSANVSNIFKGASKILLKYAAANTLLNDVTNGFKYFVNSIVTILNASGNLTNQSTSLIITPTTNVNFSFSTVNNFRIYPDDSYLVENPYLDFLPIFQNGMQFRTDIVSPMQGFAFPLVYNYQTEISLTFEVKY